MSSRSRSSRKVPTSSLDAWNGQIGIIHWAGSSNRGAGAVAIAAHRTGCPAADSSKRANDNGMEEMDVSGSKHK